MKREKRLESAKNWIKTFTGSNLVKGYSKKYSVDKLCAIKELRTLGVSISHEYESNLKNSIQGQKNALERKKFEKEQKKFLEIESDENFAFIVGYTSGGASFGLAYEEMEGLNEEKISPEFDKK